MKWHGCRKCRQMWFHWPWQEIKCPFCGKTNDPINFERTGAMMKAGVWEEWEAERDALHAEIGKHWGDESAVRDLRDENLRLRDREIAFYNANFQAGAIWPILAFLLLFGVLPAILKACG